jgi:uncharacterized protein
MSVQATHDDLAVFEAFPDIHITRDNITHYRGLIGRRLTINRCGDCRTWIYPHRPMCPQCWSWNVNPREVSGLGRVYMFTRLHQLRDPAAQVYEPIPVAAVELVEQQGLRYLSRIVGCAADEIVHDMPVELTWIDIDGRDWPAFRPFAR